MAVAESVSTNDRLSFTLFLALAFHALIIFGVGFSLSLGDKIAPTLNITLATSKSDREPDKADFLAQQNQEASGESEQVKELSTREQAEFASEQIQEVTPAPQEQSTTASQAQKEVLTSFDADARIAKLEDEDQSEDREKKLAQDANIPVTNPDKAALQAKLDRLREQEAKRPRIRRMYSVAARSSKDAEYLNEWNSRVENIGNRNFPRAALDQRLFGSMRIAVALNGDGTIHNVDIISPSKHDVLNQAALQIVYLSAPFDAIPTEVLDGYDKLEIIRTWKFEITGLTSTGDG